MNVTANEMKVITAIIKSEYGEQPHDEVWTQYMAEDSGLDPKVFSGVVSSLVKKGLVKSWDQGKRSEWTMHLTETGVKFYYDSLGLPVPKFK